MTAKQALLSNAVKALSYIGERFDGWTNQFTGLGVWGRDKTLGTRFREDCILSLEEITSLYVGDDMAALIVDTVPDTMYRKGFEVVTDENDEREPINEAVRTYNVAKLFKEGKRWGRCYGGALLVIGADDGGNADEPLNEQRIQTMRPSRVIDRRWAWPLTYYTDSEHPKYGMPETYQITTWNGTWGVRQAVVHETRLILFGGATTPEDKKLQNNSWDYSILQRCYGPLRQFENNYKSLELLLADASQAVYGVKNLWDIIAQGQEQVLIQRMQMIDLARSVARAIVMDKDNETFERKTTTMAGVPDSIDRSMQRLSAAARIPVSILMGRSAAGMNSTGDLDLEWFYNDIESARDEEKPKIKRFVELMCLAKDGPTNGIIPKQLEIEFKALRELTEEQKSKIYSTNAAADVQYITEGVLTKDEVALSRFGPRGYSQNIVIVREPREEMLDPKLIDEELNAEPEAQTQDPNQQQKKGTPAKGTGSNDN